MGEYIVVDDRATWPAELYSEAEKICHRLDLLNRVNLKTNVEYYTLAEIELNPFFNSYNMELYQPFYNIVLNQKVLCHHFSKLLQPDIILLDGLHCNTWNNYKKEMEINLITLGLQREKIDRALVLLKKEHDRKYNPCFSSAKDVNFTTCQNDVHAHLYGAIVGGELAECLEVETEIYKLLENNGEPCRVDFVIPIKDIFDKESFAYKMLICEMAKIIWDKEYPLYFDGIVKRDIKHEEIIKVNKLQNIESWK